MDDKRLTECKNEWKCEHQKNGQHHMKETNFNYIAILLLVLSIAGLVFTLTSCVSTNAPKGDITKPSVITLPGEDFIVIGDFGVANADQYAVGAAIGEFCKIKVCDFGVTVGDNFYSSGVKSVRDPLWQTAFEIPYKSIGFTFYPTFGNHDYLGDYSSQLIYHSNRWHFPHRYYKLITPAAEIFATDTEHFDSVQASALKAGLAAVPKGKWRIVYTHRPVYSSGSHGNTLELDKLMKPLLKNVDVYIAGHDHHAELQDRDGTIHIVAGNSGKLRSVTGSKHAKWARSELGFTHLDFSSGGKLNISFLNKKKEVMYSYWKVKA